VVYSGIYELFFGRLVIMVNYFVFVVVGWFYLVRVDYWGGCGLVL